MNDTLMLAKDSLLNTNPILSNIVIAIIIFVIGLILGGLLGKLVAKFFEGLGLDPALRKKAGIKIPLGKIISGLIQISIYILFLFIALNYVGVSSLLLNILFVAIILILCVSLVLSLKDLIPNFASGRVIRKSGLKVGKKLKVENVEGEIVEMNLLEIKIKASNGDVFHIPNSLFVKEKYITKK